MKLAHKFPSSLAGHEPERRTPNELSALHQQEEGGDPAQLSMTAKLRDLARLMETSAVHVDMMETEGVDEETQEAFTVITIKIQEAEMPESADQATDGMPNLGFKNIPDIVQTS